MPLQAEPILTESQLHRWRLVEEFRERLERVFGPVKGGHPSWSDPQRRMFYADYLSLYLFGLLNPVVRTMRALCAASQLQRVQEEICSRRVSLGSFSEAQHLLDPELLERVFVDLAAEVHGRSGPGPTAPAPGLDGARWDAVAGAAAHELGACMGADAAAESGVKLHLSLHLLEDKPVRATVRRGKDCERAVWHQRIGKRAMPISATATMARTTNCWTSWPRRSAPMCCGCASRQSSPSRKNCP